MPSRGSYTIASREEGKAAQRDQSYRSCVLALVIFFLLCLLLIIVACFAGKSRSDHPDHQNDAGNDAVETARINGRVKETSTPSTVGTDTNIDDVEDIENTESHRPRNKPGKSGKLTDRISNISSSTESTVHTERYVVSNTTGNTEKSERPTTTVPTWSSPKTTVQVILRATKLALSTTVKSPEIALNETSPSSAENVITPTEEIETTEMSSTPIDYPTASIRGVGDSREEVEDSTTAEATERVTFYSTNSTNSTLELNTEETTENVTSTTEETRKTTNSTSLRADLEVSTEEAVTSTITKPTEQVAFYATHSTLNDTEEETTESLLSVTRRNYDGNVASTNEETKTTEMFYTTMDYSTSLKAGLEDSAREVVTSTTTAEPTEQEMVHSRHSTLNDAESTPLNETQSIAVKYFITTIEDTATTKNFSTTTDYPTSLLPGLDDSTDGREKRQDETVKDPLDSQKTSESTNFSSTTSQSFSTTTIGGPDTKVQAATTSNSLVENTNHSSLTPKAQEFESCNTTSCRRITSRMAYYMNHGVEACEDFYEYACGGFEANDLMTDNDLSQQVYRKIQRQAKKSKSHSSARYNAYYDSCLNYETKFGYEQRIHLAREALAEVGKFVSTADSHDGIQDFTEMFTKMLKHNRPLFFDIVPDVNENHPDEFTLRIGPAVSDKVFQFANGPGRCARNYEETDQDDVDLDQLYSDYEDCRDDLVLGRFMSSINQTLRDLGVFANLNNTYDTFQYISQTLTTIDGILVRYPPEREIYAAYRSKKYSIMMLEDLQRGWKLLNLTQLIKSLTGTVMEPHTYLQVYNKEILSSVMERLDALGPLELNNALLALYARNLYQDLVATKPSRDLQKYCSNVAAHFMAREASELYISLFTDGEIAHMKTVMRQVFDELKETLRQNIKKSNWATEKGIVEMIKKVDGIEMSLPERSAVKIEDANELDITDNYFTNTIKLMKKYRIMIYGVITKKPLDEIWTFFAAPFDTIAQTIYGLSLIVMPFGAADWSTVPESGANVDYLTYATIGNLIAREIAHNFDNNGICYWNGSKDSAFAVVTGSNAELQSYEAYVKCHAEHLYARPVDMTLLTTGQRVSFSIPTLSVNERLSDVMGMRLASDTLDRLGLAATQHPLPWLKLNVNQSFYLAYAQTHCTKAPLTSSYVSLHEDRFLPSRIRVFVQVSNNILVGGAWQCRLGSGIVSDPESVCPTFPHLDKTSDYDEVASN